jgi:molybdopterin-guanine dinucleotide biosynthesis protein A
VVAAGVVLVGGRSRRMGTPKAALPWGPTTLLGHVCEILGGCVDGPLIVVRAAGQELPAVPAGAELVDDPVAGVGPLVGILAGLEAVGDRAGCAYVSAVDMPGLQPAFVRRVLSGLDANVDVVLPEAAGFRHPLAAAYRTALAGPLRELVTRGATRPAELFAAVRTRVVGADWLLADAALAAADPALASLANVNDPDDYARAYSVAFPP